MNIEKEIKTNKLVLQLLEELDKHFKTQDINIEEHSFGALKQKIMQDIMQLEMQSAPEATVSNTMTEQDIIEKLKRNPQLLDIVQTFKESE